VSGPQVLPAPADASHAGSRRIARAALAILAALVAGTAALAVVREFDHVREVEAARLQSIARLRARQVEQWLADRVAQVGFLSGSRMLAEYFERLSAMSDPADRARLLERLETYRRANGYEEAIVLDGQARVFARERAATAQIEPELADAARQALASGQPRHTGLYLRRGDALPVRIDFVAPLRSTGSPARAALVLRADPRRQLFPMLHEWPSPSPTGQTVLWRRDAERAVALSEPEGVTAPRTGIEVSMSDTSRPVARLLRGDARAGDVIDGVDFMGNAVIATGQPIDGTDGWLIARVGRDEVLAPARRFAWAVAAAVAMALVAAAVGARVLAQRAELARARRERGASATRSASACARSRCSRRSRSLPTTRSTRRTPRAATCCTTAPRARRSACPRSRCSAATTARSSRPHRRRH